MKTSDIIAQTNAASRACVFTDYATARAALAGRHAARVTTRFDGSLAADGEYDVDLVLLRDGRICATGVLSQSSVVMAEGGGLS